MVRASRNHGIEVRRAVQITCSEDMVAEFLRKVSLVETQILAQETDLIELLPENPAVGRRRFKLTDEHLWVIEAQWRQCTDADAELAQIIHAHLRKKARNEEGARRTRIKAREVLQ